MDVILQIICIVAVGIEFVLLLLSALAVGSSIGKARIVLGVCGCLIFLAAVGAVVLGVLKIFGIKFGFLGDFFYGIFDYILFWAVLAFGAAIALFAIIAGFTYKRASKAEIEDKRETAVDNCSDEETPKRVIEDIFAGLNGVDDIDDFLGDTDTAADGVVEAKIQTLKKLEKLLK